MKIERLVLEKVACFDTLDITFQPGRDPEKADIHLIVGPNGSGKSTILMALAQFFTNESTGIEKRMRNQESRAFLKVDFGERGALALYEEQQAIPQIEWEGTSLRHTRINQPLAYFDFGSFFRYRQHCENYLPSNHTREYIQFNYLVFAYSGLRSMEPYNLQSIQEQRDNPLKNACVFHKTRPPDQPDPLVQWIANTKAKAAFAQNDGKEADATRYREAVGRIEDVISRVIDKQFSFTMTYDPLNVGGQIDGQDLELDVLPDGLKSLISWIADLLMRMDRVPWVDDTPILERPFVLFLDEIEVHLHPAWQRKLLPTVQALFPKAQVFISTHSPFVIASADDAWIYPLQLEGRLSTVGQPLRSMLGSSYAAVLRDILGIEAEFAPQVEEKLTSFYDLRDRALRREERALEELKAKSEELKAYGEEVYAIVVPELRQVERRLSQTNKGSAA